MLRSVLVVLWTALLWIDFALLTALMWLLSFLPRRALGHWYTCLFRYWCRAFVHALRVDLRLHQQNARPLPERYLMIANHPSAFEDIGLPALFHVYSLAKEEVRDWWIVGRIAVAAGTLFVQRESRESRRAAALAIHDTLREGHNVALYPEGGCKGRRLAPEFKFGAVDASLATATPIVPVFIHYEAQEVFEWGPGQNLVQKLWHFLTSPNRVAHYYVFDAFDPAAFTDRDAYNQHVYQQYLDWQRRFLE